MDTTSNLLVVRLRSIGDVILTTPCLEAVKKRYPDIRISYLVEAACAPVLEGNPHIDNLLILRKDWRSQVAIFWHLLTTRYYMAINLHGGPRSILLTLAAFARKRLGTRTGSPLCRFYTQIIKHPRDFTGVDRKYHMVERNLSAFEQAGFDVGKERKEGDLHTYLFPTDDAVARAGTWIAENLGNKPFAVIHMIKRSDDNQWDWDKAREVFKHLEEKHGLSAVLLGGPSDKEAMAALRAGNDNVHNACSLPLQVSVALMARAKLFFGIDSGPAHIAAAQNLPVVVLFGFTASYLWRPWGTDVTVIEKPEDKAMIDIDCDNVIDAIEGKLCLK